MYMLDHVHSMHMLVWTVWPAPGLANCTSKAPDAPDPFGALLLADRQVQMELKS